MPCHALSIRKRRGWGRGGLQMVEKSITSRIVIDPKGLQSPERNATPRENLVMLWLFCG